MTFAFVIYQMIIAYWKPPNGYLRDNVNRLLRISFLFNMIRFYFYFIFFFFIVMRLTRKVSACGFSIGILLKLFAHQNRTNQISSDSRFLFSLYFLSFSSTRTWWWWWWWLYRAAPKYDTAYACEEKTLTIGCEPGYVINLIRANYGRFSITICNDQGNVDWSVNCMSAKSLRVLYAKCSHKQNCSILASTNTFGDPCPGTHKYLEAHYQCVSGKHRPAFCLLFILSFSFSFSFARMMNNLSHLIRVLFSHRVNVLNCMLRGFSFIFFHTFTLFRFHSFTFAANQLL